MTPWIALFNIKHFFSKETSVMLKQAHRSHLDHFFECAIGNIQSSGLDCARLHFMQIEVHLARY